MHTLRIAVIALVCAALMAPASAQADTSISFLPAAGPVLAAGVVFWAEERPDGGFDLRKEGTMGDQLVQAFPAPRGYRLVPRLAASPGRLALEVYGQAQLQGGQTFGASYYQAYVSDGGGPLVTVAPRCDFNQAFDLLRSIDASEQALIFRGPACTQETVREGGHDSTPGAAPNFGGRVAGPYAAWLEGGAPGTTVGSFDDVVVFDRAAAAVAYRLPASSLPDRVTSLALRADGTVYVVFRTPGFQSALAWASIQEPYLHRLDALSAGHIGLQLAGDDLLVLRSGRYSAATVGSGQLGLYRSDGTLVRLVARGAADASLNELFASDGTAVAYAHRDCRGVSLRRQLLAAGGDQATTPASCPLRVPRVTRASRVGRIALRFSCAGMTRACIASRANLMTVGGHRHVLLARGASVALGRARLRLTSKGRRLLTNHRRVAARFTVRLEDCCSGEGTRNLRSSVTWLRR